MARMPFKRYAGFGLLACLGFTSGVQARDRLMQPAETLVAAAKAHVVAAMDVPSGASLTVAFNPPDLRLRFPQCTQPLQAEAALLPPAGGPLSVRVQCPAPRCIFALADLKWQTLPLPTKSSKLVKPSNYKKEPM